MSKFYFHFASAGVFSRDTQGKELSNLAEAHGYGVRLIEQATCYFHDARDWSGWTVRICSPEGRLLLAVIFPYRAQASINRRRIA